jgi:hypothetical protein
MCLSLHVHTREREREREKCVGLEQRQSRVLLSCLTYTCITLTYMHHRAFKVKASRRTFPIHVDVGQIHVEAWLVTDIVVLVCRRGVVGGIGLGAPRLSYKATLC